MTRVAAAPMSQITAESRYQGRKGDDRLLDRLTEGLWYHTDLGIVRINIDKPKKTITVSNGVETLGPLGLDSVRGGELAEALSELRGQTSTHDVVDGFDATGREAYPASIGAIQALMAGVEREIRERTQAQRLRKDIKAELATTTENSSWGDRNLWGLFGDGERNRKLGVLNDQVEIIEAQTQEEELDVDQLEGRINEAVARHLAKQDPAFMKLRAESAAATDFASAARTVVSRLDKAIKECKEGASAKSTDAATDMLSAAFGDDGVIGAVDRMDDMTSSWEVDEAKDAVRNLDSAFRHYQTTGERYAALRSDVHVADGRSTDVDSGDFDFIVDTIFDMDLLGIFSASSLASNLDAAADHYESQRPELVQTRDQIARVAHELSTQVEQRVAAHREVVASAPSEAPVAPRPLRLANDG